MPTYEYACDTCGLFDVFQSMSEDAYKVCPQCKGRKIQRVISGGAGVIFKGDGFWETDYNRSEDYKAKVKSDAGDGDSSKDSDRKGDAASKEVSKSTEKKTSSDTDKATPQSKPQAQDQKKKSGPDEK